VITPEDHRLHAVAQPELGEHVRDVRLHRAAADHEPPGDLGVGEPASRRVASIPSMRGMRMSMTTSEGRSRRVSSIASRPPAASAGARGTAFVTDVNDSMTDITVELLP
jgi:hypothetical protein